jgi:hypothetical protein
LRATFFLLVMVNESDDSLLVSILCSSYLPETLVCYQVQLDALSDILISRLESIVQISMLNSIVQISMLESIVSSHLVLRFLKSTGHAEETCQRWTKCNLEVAAL